MSLKPESKYPNRRAFVLKLRSDASADQLSGRLESLVTGKQTEFACGRELIGLIARELEADAAEQPQGRAT
jgi:hypothetical protein